MERSRNVYRLPLAFYALTICWFLGASCQVSAQAPNVTGELKKWHKITLTFDGPSTSETASPNPFSDYRLEVTFSKGSKSYRVPGYFAACGNAAENGCTAGNKWRVHFAPDETGTWNYSVTFKQGSNVAINGGGSAVSPVDGFTGTLQVSASDKSGLDNRAQGRLLYVGEHYLQYSETGKYFFKVGADAPENTLAYEDFDDTPNRRGRRKNWQPHQQDYSAADASAYTWQNGKGTEMLGMVKYLSDQGMNAFSFLTFSLSGDDENVFPHLLKVPISQYNSFGDADQWNQGVHHDRFDVSKLDQWEHIFEYADKKGMYLHFKTQETENDQRMDGGNVARERKLYYRELVARFAHHLALNWNTGEENSQTSAQEIAMADYLEAIDPYNHNRVMHTYPGQKNRYNSLIGNKSEYTGASLQSGVNAVHNDTRTWVNNSRNAGKKWVVANDEQGDAQTGVSVDASFPDSKLPENRGKGDNREAIRYRVLWGNLLAGGAGVEYYYGYSTGCDDLDCQDHRSRASKWRDAKVAKDFFDQYLEPYATQMLSADGVTNDGDDYVFAKEGEVYAIYRPNGGSTGLSLPGANSNYQVQWLNPITGNMQNPSTLGNNLQAPNNNQDWVALILKKESGGGNDPNQAPTLSFTSPSNNAEFAAGSNIEIIVNATDADGSISKVEFFNGQTLVETQSQAPYTYTLSNASEGSYTIRALATDNEGATVEETIAFTVKANDPNPNPAVFSIPGNIEAEAADELVGSIRVENTPNSDGQNLGFIKNGDFANYPVEVTAGGTYQANFTVSSAGSGGTIEIFVDNNKVGEVSVPVNGQWHNYSIQSTDIALSAGTKVLKLVFSGPNGYLHNLDKMSFTPKQVQNQAPVARAGADQTVTDQDNNGTETITLDGAASSDSDGNITSYVWTLDGNPIASGAKTTTTLPVGTHVITLTVTDNATPALTDTDQVTITVEAGQSSGGTSSFVLVNANTNTEISPLTNNDVVNKAEVGNALSIIYVPSQSVGSVFLKLTGAKGNEQTENISPYALDGDSNGDYNAFSLPSGSYTLSATAYSGKNKSGSVLAQETINFALTDQTIAQEPNQTPVAQAGLNQLLKDEDNDGSETISLNASASQDPDGSIQSYVWTLGGNQIAKGKNANVSLPVGTHTITLTVSDDGDPVLSDTDQVTVIIEAGTIEQGGEPTSFILVDASADVNIRRLVSNDVINQANEGSALSIDYLPGQSVESVVFKLTGPTTNTQTENFAPYALNGNEGEDFRPFVFLNGDYTLVATAYKGKNGTGSVITSETIEFSVINSNAKQKNAEAMNLVQASAYPNPMSQDQVGVKLSKTISGQVSYVLTNTQGDVLAEGSLYLETEQSQINLDFGNYTALQGIYYLRLKGQALPETTLKLVRR